MALWVSSGGGLAEVKKLYLSSGGGLSECKELYTSGGGGLQKVFQSTDYDLFFLSYGTSVAGYGGVYKLNRDTLVVEHYIRSGGSIRLMNGHATIDNYGNLYIPTSSTIMKVDRNLNIIPWPGVTPSDRDSLDIVRVDGTSTTSSRYPTMYRDSYIGGAYQTVASVRLNTSSSGITNTSAQWCVLTEDYVFGFYNKKYGNDSDYYMDQTNFRCRKDGTGLINLVYNSKYSLEGNYKPIARAKKYGKNCFYAFDLVAGTGATSGVANQTGIFRLRDENGGVLKSIDISSATQYGAFHRETDRYIYLSGEGGGGRYPYGKIIRIPLDFSSYTVIPFPQVVDMYAVGPDDMVFGATKYRAADASHTNDYSMDFIKVDEHLQVVASRFGWRSENGRISPSSIVCNTTVE